MVLRDSSQLLNIQLNPVHGCLSSLCTVLVTRINDNGVSAATKKVQSQAADHIEIKLIETLHTQVLHVQGRAQQ